MRKTLEGKLEELQKQRKKNSLGKRLDSYILKFLKFLSGQLGMDFKVISTKRKKLQKQYKRLKQQYKKSVQNKHGIKLKHDDFEFKKYMKDKIKNKNDDLSFYKQVSPDNINDRVNLYKLLIVQIKRLDQPQKIMYKEGLLNNKRKSSIAQRRNRY